MKLKELLAKITPLPWRTGDLWHTIFGPPNGLPCPSVIAQGIQNKHHALYLKHAANVLPEVVKALAQCEDVIGMARLQGKLTDNPFSPVNDALIAARAALDKAGGRL